MPLYTYQCADCGIVAEHLTKYETRDDPMACECGGALRRAGLELVTVGQPGYQMQAILANGQKVSGHFGKDAKRNRK